MKTNLKKIGAGILTIMMTLVLFVGTAAASTQLQNGQYTINVQALHATNDEPSRSDGSIVKPVKLEVQSNKIFVILEMANSMYDLAVDNGSGSFALAEEVAENEADKTVTYKFPVSTIDQPVSVEAVVAAMGSKVKFRIAFDKGTLTNVTPQAAAPSQNTSKTSGNTNTEVANPQTGDNSFAYLGILVLIASALSISAFAISKTKEKIAAQG
jgi:heme-binding NEAT domain protein